MKSKFHNPVAVAAALRSGAGKHRETRVETPCVWCGEDTGDSSVYCSDACEVDAVSWAADVLSALPSDPWND